MKIMRIYWDDGRTSTVKDAGTEKEIRERYEGRQVRIYSLNPIRYRQATAVKIEFIYWNRRVR